MTTVFHDEPSRTGGRVSDSPPDRTMHRGTIRILSRLVVAGLIMITCALVGFGSPRHAFRRDLFSGKRSVIDPKLKGRPLKHDFVFILPMDPGILVVPRSHTLTGGVLSAPGIRYTTVLGPGETESFDCYLQSAVRLDRGIPFYSFKYAEEESSKDWRKALIDSCINNVHTMSWRYGMRPFGSPLQLEQRRLRAISLLKQGLSPVDVAKRVGADRRSVRRWKAEFRRKGRNGLVARPAPGRPPKLSPRHKISLERLLMRGAKRAGFPTDLWTCPRVADLIKRRFGVTYHVDHIVRLLHSMGWSPQKPERRARERDEEAIQRWVKQEWPRLKKKRRN